MWIHLLTLGLISGAGGSLVAVDKGAGFVINGKAAREVYHKPLRQRVIEAAQDRNREVTNQSRLAARVIEVKAAEIAFNDGSEAKFQALMGQWTAKRVNSNPDDSQAKAEELFMAKVALHLKMLQMAKQTDEDDAIFALLMT